MTAALGTVAAIVIFSVGYWVGYKAFNRQTKGFDEEDWRLFLSAYGKPKFKKGDE